MNISKIRKKIAKKNNEQTNGLSNVSSLTPLSNFLKLTLLE